jgi:hypothetical protein
MAGNTTITDETRRKLEALVGPDKVDELAEQLLSEYVARQDTARRLKDLASWGQGHAKRMGYKPSDVARAIAETRTERNGR